MGNARWQKWNARNREVYVCKTFVIHETPGTEKYTFVINVIPGTEKRRLTI